MNLDDALKFITSQTDSDTLNLLSEAVRVARRNCNFHASSKLALNDLVEFDARGTVMRGVITKINKTTIKVKTAGGLHWRVSPTLLRKV